MKKNNSSLNHLVQLVFILFIALFFSSCSRGYYAVRTTNIPQLDSSKKSDVNIKLGFGSFEIQQNHLISNRFVFQNNISIILSEPGINGVGEVGLGYYLNKDYSNLLLLGLGYSHQDYEYLESHWTGYDASYVKIYAPVQYNTFLQFSKLIRTNMDKNTYDINAKFNIYERTDFCIVEDVYKYNEYSNLPYIVQDFGGSLYLRAFRLNIACGIKFAFSWESIGNTQLMKSPPFYLRVSLRF